MHKLMLIVLVCGFSNIQVYAVKADLIATPFQRAVKVGVRSVEFLLNLPVAVKALSLVGLASAGLFFSWKHETPKPLKKEPLLKEPLLKELLLQEQLLKEQFLKKEQLLREQFLQKQLSCEELFFSNQDGISALAQFDREHGIVVDEIGFRNKVAQGFPPKYLNEKQVVMSHCDEIFLSKEDKQTHILRTSWLNGCYGVACLFKYPDGSQRAMMAHDGFLQSKVFKDLLHRARRAHKDAIEVQFVFVENQIAQTSVPLEKKAMFLKLFHMFIGAEPIMLSYSEQSDFTVFLQEDCPARWEVSVVE